MSIYLAEVYSITFNHEWDYRSVYTLSSQLKPPGAPKTSRLIYPTASSALVPFSQLTLVFTIITREIFEVTLFSKECNEIIEFRHQILYATVP
jgi:hypothetical protein